MDRMGALTEKASDVLIIDGYFQFNEQAQNRIARMSEEDFRKVLDKYPHLYGVLMVIRENQRKWLGID